MKTFSIFGLGTVVDHQVVMRQMPEKDHKGEVLDDRYQVGGPVPTALCLLRRFGVQATFQGKWSQNNKLPNLVSPMGVFCSSIRHGIYFA